MIVVSVISNVFWIIYAVLNSLSSMMMGVFSVLVFIVEAIVVVLMLIIIEVRTFVRIIGVVSGSSILRIR